MRILRNCIAMLLVTCLVLGLCANGVTVLAQDYTYHYVSLGASQSNGYGLQGYLPVTVNNGQVPDDQLPLLNGLLTGQIDKNSINVYGYQRAPEGSYPDLIRDALEQQGHTVLLDQLAISSMRAEELRMLLDNDYYGDAYTRWRFYDENGNGWFSSAAKEEGMTNEEALAALRSQYQNAIADANLITVDIGVNNFGVYVINQIDSGLDNPENAKYDADFSVIFEDEAEMAAFQDEYQKIEQMITDALGSENKSLQFLVDTFAYAYIGFCVNFDKSMETIYTLNPDATVVVVSIQNLLEGVLARIPGMDKEIPLGKLYGAIVNMANLYTASQSPYADRYFYADAGNVSLYLDDILAYNGDPATLSQDMRDAFGLYDNDLFGWELFLEYGQYPGQDISAGTTAVYGALAEIAKACAQKNVIDFGAIASMDEAEDALGAFIETTLQEAFVAGMSGQPYELDRSVLDNPDYATAMAIAIRFTLGNSFFAHPSRAGHRERADAILAAVANETKGDEFTMQTVLEMALDAVNVMDYYANQPYYYEVQSDSFYLAFGDDVAAASGSYVEKLAAELGVSYKNLAAKGSVVLDAFDIVQNNKELIEKADLITLGYSNNSATRALVKTFVGMYKAENDWASLVGEENVPAVTEALAQLKQLLIDQGMGGSFLGMNLSDLIPQAIENYAYFYIANLMNTYLVADAIHEINPDAQVVILSTYNDLENVVLDLSGLILDVGTYSEYLNKILAISNVVYTASAKNTAFAYAPDVETLLDKNTAEGKYTQMSGYGYLITVATNDALRAPTDAGHNYIKDQILATMAKPPVYVLGDVNGDGAINTRDAKLIMQYELGLVDSNELILDMADVNGDGAINTRDAKLIMQLELGLITQFPV